MADNKPSGIFEMVRTVVYAVGIALAVRTVAFEPFNIPSGSMIPTLIVGDYLFVSKSSYGYSRYSLPLGLPLFSGRIFATQPERGDVAVFKLPADNKTDYIKRIIGLPGDRIRVNKGVLTINGVPVKRERIEDYLKRESGGNMVRRRQYRETLPNGRTSTILEISDNEMADNFPETLVPPGHYFAMGNNRDNSSDSRFSNVGFIPVDNLVGRAKFIFFSIDGALWKFWNWPSSIRSERIFTSIH
jgi:signal peptidase I